MCSVILSWWLFRKGDVSCTQLLRLVTLWFLREDVPVADRTVPKKNPRKESYSCDTSACTVGWAELHFLHPLSSIVALADTRRFPRVQWSSCALCYKWLHTCGEWWLRHALLVITVPGQTGWDLPLSLKFVATLHNLNYLSCWFWKCCDLVLNVGTQASVIESWTTSWATKYNGDLFLERTLIRTASGPKKTNRGFAFANFAFMHESGARQWGKAEHFFSTFGPFLHGVFLSVFKSSSPRWSHI